MVIKEVMDKVDTVINRDTVSSRGMGSSLVTAPVSKFIFSMVVDNKYMYNLDSKVIHNHKDMGSLSKAMELMGSKAMGNKVMGRIMDKAMETRLGMVTDYR